MVLMLMALTLGLEALTTEKFVVYGDGQIRA